MTEFNEFVKIPRLNRPVVVTEKLDGTNGQVVIIDITLSQNAYEHAAQVTLHHGPEKEDRQDFAVLAGSRKRYITPHADVHGFAAWVWSNAGELVKTLGEGRHYGEWWGHRINRGYDLPKGDKRFSLFNTKRWHILSEKAENPLGVHEDVSKVPGLRVVPIIGTFDTFDTRAIETCVEHLRQVGSEAVPCYDRPEGIVVYHAAGSYLFKVTLEGDESPKSLIQEAMERRAQYA